MSEPTGDEKAMQDLIDRMLKGDPRCPIPIDARIEKTNTEPGDTVNNGHKGYVRGSIFVEPKNESLYMVQWDGIEIPKEIDGIKTAVPYIAVAGHRIKQIAGPKNN